MDCSLPGSSLHGILQARILSRLPFPSPGDLPDPGIEPRSPALQADSLPSESLVETLNVDDKENPFRRMCEWSRLNEITMRS